MKGIWFKDRDGATPLTLKQLEGLIPKNLTLMKDLDEFEAENMDQGFIWLQSKGTVKVLNLSFMKKFHKSFFGEVWKWAGEWRDTETNIGVMPFNIQIEMTKLIEDIKVQVEHKSQTDKKIASEFHFRFEKIHPFNDGNGRTGRVLTNLLCKEFKFEAPTWGSSLDKKERRSQYISAIKKCYDEEYSSLIKFMYMQ
jgi:Fic-DOC domain mobile mystery protein B